MGIRQVIVMRGGNMEEHGIEKRQSGIELLKIIGMVLIVIAHVQGSVIAAGRNWDCVQSMNTATENWQYVILMMFGYFGCLGNNIFLISSAWFLCGSGRKRSNKKMLNMVLDVWIISVMYLLLFVVLGEKITIKDAIKSFFPTILNNNWYITGYLLLYAVFPYLNRMIERMTQRELLTFNIAGFCLYYGISFVKRSFFVNEFILFIVMYFFIAYIKTYMNTFFAGKKVNYTLLLLGGGMTAGITLLTNFVGLKIEYIGTHIGYWVSMSNPFLLMIAVALFQIFRQKTFVNTAVNIVSGLSLYVYIIHENLLMRTIFRPRVFYYIYTRAGYQYIVLWVLGFAALLFIGSAMAAFVFKCTVHRLSERITQKIYGKIVPVYDRWIRLAMKIN